MGKMERKTQRIDSKSNIVGKFTQSVRRIVQEVKDEDAASGLSRDEVVNMNVQLRMVRGTIEDSYETARHALIGLQTKYGDSKTIKNVITRYNLLKAMIKEVVRLEAEYWALMDIPKQEKQEAVAAYVVRACGTLEAVGKPGEGIKTSAKLAKEDARKRELTERLQDMTVAQVEQENNQLINDLYRLFKKYSALRAVIRNLRGEYMTSRYYPFFPRYILLKSMIRNVLHEPAFMEVCHEVES